MVVASGLYYLAKTRKAAYGVGALMILFPTLEAPLGVCVGCTVFGALMKLHLVPRDVCADISLRQR